MRGDYRVAGRAALHCGLRATSVQCAGPVGKCNRFAACIADMVSSCCRYTWVSLFFFGAACRCQYCRTRMLLGFRIEPTDPDTGIIMHVLEISCPMCASSLVSQVRFFLACACRLDRGSIRSCQISLLVAFLGLPCMLRRVSLCR